MSNALVLEIKAAYEGAADGWDRGPAAVYRSLAAALVAASPEPLAARRVLDLGAGTGVASAVLAAAGAEPVALDLAEAMLRHRSRSRPPAVVGDALALPYPKAAFGGVVAACSLNHLPEPASALAECRRVTQPGGVLVASTFPADHDHPAKPAVEATLRTFGYCRPPWYEEFKERIAPLVGDTGALARAAAAAGFAEIDVELVHVDAGLDDPTRVVEWRLRMPHTIGFVAGLPPDERHALTRDAIAALPDPLPPTVTIVVLRARVPLAEPARDAWHGARVGTWS